MRRYAIARSLFKTVRLPAAIGRLGFVQADPMRAPARAQDLILSHRVKGYRAGDLAHRCAQLDIDEVCFGHCGFLPSITLSLLHPRVPRQPWGANTLARAQELLNFVRERGSVDPSEVEQAFAHHGRAVSAWGSDLRATTHLLDDMHSGAGCGCNGARPAHACLKPSSTQPSIVHRQQAWSAPRPGSIGSWPCTPPCLPAASLTYLARLLRHGVPRLEADIRQACSEVKNRCAHAEVEGHTWFWPIDENPRAQKHTPGDRLQNAPWVTAPCWCCGPNKWWAGST